MRSFDNNFNNNHQPDHNINNSEDEANFSELNNSSNSSNSEDESSYNDLEDNNNYKDYFLDTDQLVPEDNSEEVNKSLNQILDESDEANSSNHQSITINNEVESQQSKTIIDKINIADLYAQKANDLGIIFNTGIDFQSNKSYKHSRYVHVLKDISVSTEDNVNHSIVIEKNIHALIPGKLLPNPELINNFNELLTQFYSKNQTTLQHKLIAKSYYAYIKAITYVVNKKTNKGEVLNKELDQVNYNEEKLMTKGRYQSMQRKLKNHQENSSKDNENQPQHSNKSITNKKSKKRKQKSAVNNNNSKQHSSAKKSKTIDLKEILRTAGAELDENNKIIINEIAGTEFDTYSRKTLCIVKQHNRNNLIYPVFYLSISADNESTTKIIKSMLEESKFIPEGYEAVMSFTLSQRRPCILVTINNKKFHYYLPKNSNEFDQLKRFIDTIDNVDPSIKIITSSYFGVLRSCKFHCHPNADSNASRTLIPILPEHLFQS